MKGIIIILFVFLLYLSGCDVCTTESCTTEESDDDKVVGEWVFKKGLIEGYLLDAEYSVSLNFRPGGIISVDTYVGDEQYSVDGNCVYKPAREIGTWKMFRDSIVLRDFDGIPIHDTLNVQFPTLDSLIVCFKDHESVFVKKEFEFAGLDSLLVGKWSSSGSYMSFNSDGTGVHRSVSSVSVGTVVQGFNFTWFVDGSTVVIHNVRSASGSKTVLAVSFLNHKYLGLDNHVWKREQ